MSLNEIFFGAMSGAMIVVAGGLYALFFALACLLDNRGFLLGSYICYAVLVLATGVLAVALDLSGLWIFLIVTMLVGYFYAPRAIWHLCEGTHALTDSGQPRNENSHARTVR